MVNRQRVNRLTFEFARGWTDHYNGKPFNSDETEDWQAGWYSRQTHYKRPGSRTIAAE